jgi:DNA-binding response OmpR family regulator
MVETLQGSVVCWRAEVQKEGTTVAEQPLILIVEDDMEMNELQRELLALHGMNSMPAYTGPEAVDISENHPVDAILLDIMLPEMDGFEVCEHIRKREDCEKQVPIIILTAMDGEECRQRGCAAGADAYFVKPFDPDEVIECINRLMIVAGHQ